MFSDKVTFHPSGHINLHDNRIWGSNNFHAVTEGKSESTKYTMFCAVYKNGEEGAGFFWCVCVCVQETITQIS
jgi:hypothetical protein